MGAARIYTHTCIHKNGNKIGKVTATHSCFFFASSLILVELKSSKYSNVYYSTSQLFEYVTVHL